MLDLQSYRMAERASGHKILDLIFWNVSCRYLCKISLQVALCSDAQEVLLTDGNETSVESEC